MLSPLGTGKDLADSLPREEVRIFPQDDIVERVILELTGTGSCEATDTSRSPLIPPEGPDYYGSGSGLPVTSSEG